MAKTSFLAEKHIKSHSPWAAVVPGNGKVFNNNKNMLKIGKSLMFSWKWLLRSNLQHENNHVKTFIYLTLRCCYWQ